MEHDCDPVPNAARRCRIMDYGENAHPRLDELLSTTYSRDTIAVAGKQYFQKVT